MPDSDLQHKSPSPIKGVASDSYTLLLLVGLLVLLVSLAVLGYVWSDHYGLPDNKPVIGRITSVSADLVRVDIGAKQGLHRGQTLLAMRRGIFLTALSIKSVDNDGSSAVPLGHDGKILGTTDDAQTITLAKGDTVISNPLD